MSESNTVSYYRSQLLDAVEIALQHHPDTAADLADLLYDRWYTPAVDEPVVDVSPAELVAHLRASDAFGSRFESGWIVVDGQQAAREIGAAHSPWQVAAVRGSEMRWLDPLDFIYSAAVGLKPAAGAAVEVNQRRDSLHSLKGWWSTQSPPWQEKGDAPLLRLYWSIQAPAVCELVYALTSRLDPALPYALKCPLQPARFQRPDGVTLYLATSDWRAALDAIRTSHEQSSAALRKQIPAFTFILAPGLALAEDPAEGSFGMSWCIFFSKGIWPLLRSSTRSEIVQALEISIAEHGLRLEAPYLNPGSAAGYSW